MATPRSSPCSRRERLKLEEIIIAASEAALADQAADGSFPAGRNGPYGDDETPVRTTAHWLITLLDARERSRRADFDGAVERATAYLLDPARRPGGASFLCRRSRTKDECNGLIGQAWVIEALAAAARHGVDGRSRLLAEELFLRHPFDAEAGLWERLHVDGRAGLFDRTLNHQVWFAAAGTLLDARAEGEIGARVRRFADRALESHLRVRGPGRIRHKIEVGEPAPAPGEARAARARLVRQEIGYQAYNLYGLAMIRRAIPEHALWTADSFRAALRFARSACFARALEGNEFGYPYNPVGFEMALALQTFAEPAPRGERTASWWFTQEIERSFDAERRNLGRGSGDPVVLAARLYEATRLDGERL